MTPLVTSQCCPEAVLVRATQGTGLLKLYDRRYGWGTIMSAHNTPSTDVPGKVRVADSVGRVRAGLQLFPKVTMQPQRDRLNGQAPRDTAMVGFRDGDPPGNARQHSRNGKANQNEQWQLHYANRSQGNGTSVARIAHDLRNLLMVITGHVDLAVDDLAGNHPALERFEAIEQAVHQCGNLADALAGFASQATLVASRGCQPCVAARQNRVASVPAIRSESSPGLPEEQCGELILVVQNNDHIRGIITAMLRAKGHKPISAANTVEAVAALEANRDALRLAVLDLDLPAGDGLRCLRELRRMRDDLPVILVTDNVGSQPADQLNGTGFVLSKPFRTTELNGLVARVLAKSGPKRTNRC